MVKVAIVLVAIVVALPLAAATGTDAAPSLSPSGAAQLATRLGEAAASAREGFAADAGATGSAAAAALASVAGLASAAGAALAGAAAGAWAALRALGSLLASWSGQGYAYARDHPQQAAAVAGGATLLAALACLAKRFGALLVLPLYTRLAPSQMLDNRARNAVYEHVRDHPGAHPSAIADALHLGWGTVVYHLGRLESSRLVVAKDTRHRKCYFAVGSTLNADERSAVAAMAHDKAKLIVQIVQAAPGISQKEVAERVGMSQALASWHVKRLVESGVLRSERAGRSHALRVAAHVPTLAPAPPAAVAA